MSSLLTLMEEVTVDCRSTIESAVGTGEVIRVRYHGGMRKGRVRDLQIHSVDGPLVRAVCLESQRFKTFRLDRMELASDAAVDYVKKANEPGLRMTMLRPSRRMQNAEAPGLFNRLARWMGWRV